MGVAGRMDREYLLNLLPFLKEADKERQEQFARYFQNAPLWLMDEFVVEKMKADTTFIWENEPADTIYFILDGSVKAMDYRIYTVNYDFMKPKNLIALGGLEVLMDLDTYRASVKTETAAIAAKLPRKQYEKWLFSDVESLRMEAKITSEYLLEENRKNRLYLFLQGSDRLALLLVTNYEKNQKDGQLRIRENRKGLAEETGLCQKTITRSVKKFEEMHLLTKEGNQLLITKEQYEGLKQIVEEKVEKNGWSLDGQGCS